MMPDQERRKLKVQPVFGYERRKREYRREWFQFYLGEVPLYFVLALIVTLGFTYWLSRVAGFPYCTGTTLSLLLVLLLPSLCRGSRFSEMFAGTRRFGGELLEWTTRRRVTPVQTALLD